MVYDDYADIGIFAKWVMDAPEIGGAGTSIGGKKMSLHEKGDQTRALNHNSDFSARFCVDFSKFANVCEFHFRNLSKRPFILPRIPCGFVGVSKPVSSVCFICRPTGALFL